MMPLNSIRSRLTLAIALASALLMMTICVGLLWFVRHTAERNTAMILRAAAHKVRLELEGGEQHYELSDAVGENREFLQTENLAMLIIDEKGRVVKRSQGAVPAWPRDEAWRMVVLPFRKETLVIASPWAKTESALHNQALVLSALSVLVVLFSSAGAWWLVGRTLSPISRLSQQAKEVSADDLNLRLSASSQDAEIVQLVDTLNSLLERVSQTVAAKEHFHAAASHELRTPLQVLSGCLEVALSRERTAPEYRTAMEEGFRQTQRLISLTQGLLLLNQLDSVSSCPPCEPVDLSDICQRVLAHLQPQIALKALKVQQILLADEELLAPATYAEMLIRNLIENAVKYASPNGTVDIHLSSSPRRTTLFISNECISLPRLDVQQVYKPFYRSDASRNSETGGNGLGLAICKAIATVNQWDMALEQDDKKVSVTVSMQSL